MNEDSWFNDPEQLLSEVRRCETAGFVVQIPGYDSLVPIASVDAAALEIPNCEYVRLPDTGHFEPYQGEVFDRVVNLEADFLCRHLLGAG